MPRRYVDGLEANGNRVAVTGIGTAGNTGTEIDRIDALDRLTGVTSAGGSTAEYEYDPNGNRTRLTNTPSDGTTGRRDDGTTGRRDDGTDCPRLRCGGATDHGHDAAGNLTSAGGQGR
ncbi:MAG: RHS repeat domain-containing protein [Thermomicrobiales bacterium]